MGPIPGIPRLVQQYNLVIFPTVSSGKRPLGRFYSVNQEKPQFHNFEGGIREPRGGEAGTDEDAGVDAHPH